jgi:hypothetical protein
MTGNGNTFYITGVQLEKGSTATSFDYRPYGTELALCQRYYYRLTGATIYASGFAPLTTRADAIIWFPVSMRIAPSALEQSGTASDYGVVYLATSAICNSVPTYASSSTGNAYVQFNTAAVLTAGNGILGNTRTSTAYLGWSAEL